MVLLASAGRVVVPAAVVVVPVFVDDDVFVGTVVDDVVVSVVGVGNVSVVLTRYSTDFKGDPAHPMFFGLDNTWNLNTNRALQSLESKLERKIALP